MKANVRTLRNIHAACIFAVMAVTTKLEQETEKIESVTISSARWYKGLETSTSVHTEHWPERLSAAEKYAIKKFMAKASRREYEENNSVFDVCNGHYCEYTR